MPAQSDPTSNQKPWVAHGGCTAEHEDFLIGNKAGLALLKERLDEALANGESRIEGGDVEFVGIRVVEQDPRCGTGSKKKTRKDAAALWGCGLMAFIVAFILIAGLFQIWSWIK